MNKLILTKGLPASGKSTWAMDEVTKGNGSTVNICKDNLREMLHSNLHSKGRESLVIKMQESMTDLALSEGKHVIWSDTNLNPVHIDRARNLFGKRATIVIEDSFLKVSVDECILRDSKRASPVGASVIKDQYNRWLKPEVVCTVLEQDRSLDEVILVDLDGTLAIMRDRRPYDWHLVGQDNLDETIAEIVRMFHKNGTHIIVVSGRDSVCRDETTQWLYSNNIQYLELLMRPDGDSRNDAIVKEEIFNHFIRDKYYVKFVLDDRNRVVDKWRELGLKCFQVAPGDF